MECVRQEWSTGVSTWSTSNLSCTIMEATRRAYERESRQAGGKWYDMSGILKHKKMAKKLKDRVHKEVMRPSMSAGQPRVKEERTVHVVEILMWSLGVVTRADRIRNDLFSEDSLVAGGEDAETTPSVVGHTHSEKTITYCKALQINGTRLRGKT